MSAAHAQRPDPAVSEADFARSVGLDAAAEARLEIFRTMLVDWNARINLVGASTLADFRQRHVIDSAQLIRYAPRAKTWADLGAGAGLPGLVLAILLKDQPAAHVHLVESLAKRCRFLDAVAKTLDLPVSIHNARAESLDLWVDVVTARACAPLTRLLGFAAPYFKRGAHGLFLKSQEVEAEMAQARETWNFEARIDPSFSDPRGRVLAVERLTRAR